MVTRHLGAHSGKPWVESRSLAGSGWQSPQQSVAPLWISSAPTPTASTAREFLREESATKAGPFPWEDTVRRTFSYVVVFSLLLLSANSRTVAQGQTAAAKPSVDEVLQAVRADLQATRADIMAKNLTLTAEQAAKFWPMFNKYQQEQNVLMDDQLKTIQRYVETYDKLDDAGALALMKAHFDRDTKMN